MTERPGRADVPRERRGARVGSPRRRSRSAAGPPPARPADPALPAKPGSSGPAEPGASTGLADLAALTGSTDLDASTGSTDLEASTGSTGSAGSSPAGDAPARAKRARRDGGRGARQDGGNDGPWRELTGSGRSQVSQVAALRARDADRPTAEDLAQAERDVVIQRRNWTPGS